MTAHRIAILGWGSLLWDTRPEFDDWHSDWQNDGPVLKIEFSRISESRSRALTLVIDEEHGTFTRVAHCLSKRHDPEDVICDLRCREGTTKNNIGYLFVGDNRVYATHPEALAAIRSWAYDKGFNVVVWTDLRSNFTCKTNQPFSVPAAIAHVQGLSTEEKVKAAEYVWRALEFIDTPVRRALQAEPWFLRPNS